MSDTNDSVRYTITSAPESFSANAQAGIDHLRAAGFEPLEIKRWLPKGYQGINSTWHDPVSGHLFEVQFHTPESYIAKTDTHPLYKELRLDSTDPARKLEIIQQQNAAFAQVRVPDGVADIETISRRSPPGG